MLLVHHGSDHMQEKLRMSDGREIFTDVKELAVACKNGDTARAAALLEKHPDVLDSPDRDARSFYPESCLWSPLGLAARHGHEDLVNHLLRMGANPVPFEVSAQYHHHTYEDWTNELRSRGHNGIVRSIEEAIQKRYGQLMDSPDFRQAILHGNADRLRALIRERPERVRQVDAVGNTALHLAVACNQLPLVELLVDAGASIDARNGDGRTPSVVALFGFHRWSRCDEKPEILELLLKRGAEYTILLAATRGDETRVRELLRGNRSLANAADACFRRPLSAAASKGHTDIVRLLLANGADPNAKEPVCQGGYSLHVAAWNGFTEIVRLLLDHGAIPEHWVDSSGDSLFAAHCNGHQEILQMLYAHGGTMELQVYAAAHRIDVIAEVLKLDPSKANQVLPYGWDDTGNEELALNIMRLAIRRGARFENATGWNLRWTAQKYPRVFRLLQEHGANPDLPLLGVASDPIRRYKNADEQLRILAFLVEDCRANIDCQDEDGFTPLAKAAEAGHLNLVEYLLSKGAKRTHSGPAWAQPLALAEHRGHTAIANRLQGHAP